MTSKSEQRVKRDLEISSLEQAKNTVIELIYSLSVLQKVHRNYKTARKETKIELHKLGTHFNQPATS